MVQTSVEPVYPIDNYGSAMAPFYSVLAIWVGGVMLVVILKPHARREGLVAPKPISCFSAGISCSLSSARSRPPSSWPVTCWC